MKVGLIILLIGIAVANAWGPDCSVDRFCDETYTDHVNYVVTVRKSVIEIVKSFCWNWRLNFRCPVEVRKIKTVPETRTKEVVKTRCCAGYIKQMGKCRKAPLNMWTNSTSGCPCYYDNNQDCPCCNSGGCQCSYKHCHKCIQCGYGHRCASAYDSIENSGIDQWTESESGCTYNYNGNQEDGPCCKNRGCPFRGKPRCTQCGLTHLYDSEVFDEL